MARIGAKEIDDAVQDVFLRAFRGLPRLKDPRSFGSYIGQIARNLCTDRLRAAGRASVSLDDAALEPADPRFETDTDRDLLLERLRREVGRLSDSQREVLLLFYFEKLSYAQMADLLDLSEAAVNQRLSRARQQLRAAFSASAEPRS
jgi:RNA polymerase sigma-70 factor (ECF subfamily)